MSENNVFEIAELSQEKGLERVLEQMVVNYDSLLISIEECENFDQVKKFNAEASVLEFCARVANNLEAENKVAALRITAQRVLGGFLKVSPRAKGQRLDGKDKEGNYRQSVDSTTEPKTLVELGLTGDQSSQYQKLSDIPDKVFTEELGKSLSAGTKPSAANIIKQANPLDITPKQSSEPVNENALWLWGTLREMDRLKLFDTDPQIIIQDWTPEMRKVGEKIFSRLKTWSNK